MENRNQEEETFLFLSIYFFLLLHLKLHINTFPTFLKVLNYLQGLATYILFLTIGRNKPPFAFVYVCVQCTCMYS